MPVPCSPHPCPLQFPTARQLLQTLLQRLLAAIEGQVGAGQRSCAVPMKHAARCANEAMPAVLC